MTCLNDRQFLKLEDQNGNLHIDYNDYYIMTSLLQTQFISLEGLLELPSSILNKGECFGFEFIIINILAWPLCVNTLFFSCRGKFVLQKSTQCILVIVDLLSKSQYTFYFLQYSSVRIFFCEFGNEELLKGVLRFSKEMSELILLEACSCPQTLQEYWAWHFFPQNPPTRQHCGPCLACFLHPCVQIVHHNETC